MAPYRLCRISLLPSLSGFLRNSGPNGSQSVKPFSSSSESVDLRLLKGQVAVITGGASGIGAATARLFTNHGARVVIADIQISLGEKLLKELGPQAAFVPCDVRKEEDLAKLVDEAYSLENKLDIFYSNAGIIGSVGPIDQMNLDEYDATIAVDLRGAVVGIKHAVRVMKPQKKGSIMITSSVAGLRGGMGPHGYTVAKGGLVALVKSLAAELGHYGIRVNCISPELLTTPLSAYALDALAEVSADSDNAVDVDRVVAAKSMILGKCLTTGDVANAALFLASDMAAYVSGHNLVVDGGSIQTRVLKSGVNSFYTKYMPMVSENGRRGLT